MIESLIIDYAPAHEFVVSLAVYLERSRWKSTDLGSAWGAGVEKRLGAEDKARLKAIKETADLQPLFLLAYQAPGDRTPAEFMDWLATLSPGDIYERLVNGSCEEAELTEIPRDLGAWRHRILQALRLWHECYYQHVDPAIAAHLKAEAESRRIQAATTPALELVDQATKGLLLDTAGYQRVVLVPQYHMSPWNLGAMWPGLWVLLYPVEAPQTNPDDPPLALTRLTRALSDENRLRILRFLAQAPRTLNELTERTGLAKSTVHHHMMMLRAAGLVRIHEKDRDGRYASLRPGWLDLVSGRLSGFVLPQ